MAKKKYKNSKLQIRMGDIYYDKNEVKAKQVMEPQHLQLDEENDKINSANGTSTPDIVWPGYEIIVFPAQLQVDEENDKISSVNGTSTPDIAWSGYDMVVSPTQPQLDGTSTPDIAWSGYDMVASPTQPQLDEENDKISSVDGTSIPDIAWSGYEMVAQPKSGSDDVGFPGSDDVGFPMIPKMEMDQIPLSHDGEEHHAMSTFEAHSLSPSMRDPHSMPMPLRALSSRMHKMQGSTWGKFLPSGLQGFPEEYSSYSEYPEQEAAQVPTDSPIVQAVSSTCTDSGETICAFYDQNGDAFHGVWDNMSFDEGQTFQSVFIPQGSDCAYIPFVIGEIYDNFEEFTDYPLQPFEESYQDPVAASVCISELEGNVWKRSKDPDGCREVQQAFANCSPDEVAKLAEELRGHVREACKCPHANYVLQVCIVYLERPSDIQFIIDEIMYREDSVLGVAKGRYGCRVIERLIEKADAEQLHEMSEVFLSHTAELSIHIYGNYVVQHLLMFSRDPSIQSRIIEQFLMQLPTVAATSYSGHLGAVLDRAFSTSAENRTLLANLVVSDCASLIAMARTRWGHNAAVQAFKLAEASHQKATRSQLKKRTSKDRLGDNRYGKKLLELVEPTASV